MDFVIPRVSENQIAIITSRSAGVIAAHLASDARMNTRQPNKYIDGIDPLVRSDPALTSLSQLGTPIWDRVTFSHKGYTDNKGILIDPQQITFEAILISVTFPRNIIKTVIQGRNGTVKEYIGEGDANVSFRGVICGINGHYPAAEVALLRSIATAPSPIEVYSEYLQNLDINTIVFEDRSFEQEEGGRSYQTFSLNAVSDTPQELMIT